MIEKILLLKINNNEKITINIPDFKNKINYFYKPQEKLHRFDEAIVIYEYIQKKIILEKEAVKEVLNGLKTSLKWALNNNLYLPDSVNVGEVGRNCNIDRYTSNNINNYCNYALFCEQKVQTWIYNDQFGEIYLEISPRCPLVYREYEEGDEFSTFEDFMKNYKPYAFFHIDRKTAQQWKRDVDLLYMEIDDESILH